MWFVKNPEWFDVIVTDNMFGDIITDLAAMIQGGLGVAAGGNINPEGTSMFEPMGGSAPKYTGQNVINPLAAINAASMMLDFLGESVAGAAIENAVIQIINTKIQSLAAGRMGHGTSEVGDLVAALCRRSSHVPFSDVVAGESALPPRGCSTQPVQAWEGVSGMEP
jgi:3-isopropylmalate dehydrogenase